MVFETLPEVAVTVTVPSFIPVKIPELLSIEPVPVSPAK